MNATDIFDKECLRLDLNAVERNFWQMSLIRQFEESLLQLFTAGKLDGTTHTCLGQESNAVAVMNAIDRDKDTIWSNHRCHGHFLAYCGDAYRLYAEILGRKTGVCAGRGGSQHLAWKNFFSSGIQGGLVPLGVGTANAKKDEGVISVVFLGDGTMGEGVIYEGLNLASLWSAPVLFVIEDNGIAQTTPSNLGVAGSIADRSRAFGIEAATLDTTDVDDLCPDIDRIAAEVRASKRPFWLHIKSTRLGSHSKGDDTRSEEVVADLRKRDCLALQSKKVGAERREELDGEISHLLKAALDKALGDDPACA